MLRSIDITKRRLSLRLRIGTTAHLVPQRRKLSSPSIDKPVADLYKKKPLANQPEQIASPQL